VQNSTLVVRRRPARDWTDHAENDPGIALLELLAYLGDLLSYHQDEIAAEARLATRRRYASVFVALVVVIFWRCRSTSQTDDDRSE
jgi:hypothetical protein